MEFGECMRQIMQHRQCSILQLQRKMRLKSATSISRILRNECSYSVALSFYNQLSLTNFLMLQKDEKQQLEEALEIKRLGRDVYEAYRTLEQLYAAPPMDDEAAPLTYYTAEGASLVSLGAWAREMAGCKGIKGYIFNNCSYPFFRSMMRLFSALPQEAFSLTHYFDISASPMSIVTPLVCLVYTLRIDNYEGLYQVIPNDGANGCPSSYRNKAYIWATGTDGSETVYTLHMTRDQRLFLRKAPDDGSMRNMLKGLLDSEDFRNCIPIRRKTMSSNLHNDLISLYQRLLYMEKNRGQRILWQSLCVSFIPPGTLLRMASAVPAFAREESREVVEALAGLHAERHRHIYEKKQSTHMVLSKGAMRKFAQEGYLQDHPHGFPPLTSEDRVEILEALLQQCKVNPYFHVYMGRDGFPPAGISYMSFSDLGLYVYDSDTDYSLDRPMYEAFISVDELGKLFDSFFDNVVLVKYVDNETESIAFLGSLLCELKGNSGP